MGASQVVQNRLRSPTHPRLRLLLDPHPRRGLLIFPLVAGGLVCWAPLSFSGSHHQQLSFRPLQVHIHEGMRGLALVKSRGSPFLRPGWSRVRLPFSRRTYPLLNCLRSHRDQLPAICSLMPCALDTPPSVLVRVRQLLNTVSVRSACGLFGPPVPGLVPGDPFVRGGTCGSRPRQ